MRATAPDYLPLAGPVPDPPRFAARYAALAEDARQCIAAPAPVLRNCYLSTAFGSRGLSYAALCAELLASQITGEVPPLQRELLRAVSPARFLLRAIVRGTGYNTEP